jgi:hypothetical protein
VANARPTFTFVPRRRVIGLSFGTMRSLHRGAGTDIAGSRPYRRSDSMDVIDWAASARLSTARDADEFLVRERFAEEAPKIILVCDRRPNMAHFAPPLPWLDKPAAMRQVIELVLGGGERGHRDEPRRRVEDGAVTGNTDVVLADEGQPRKVVGESRPYAASVRRMPPVLDVAFDELAARRANDVLARERGLRVEEREDVLQLIAEAERPTTLIDGGASPHPA